jgi:glyoxylase-like metal-dependent hydrolase (beta-lactamase superfamily II)
VTAIVLTHGHNDHITAAVDLRAAVEAPIWFHPDDRMLWDVVHPDSAPDRELTAGVRFPVVGVDLLTLHTPGHSPGSVCLHAPDLATVFTGDTLFSGGPGATGRSFSDRPTIERSIRSELFALHGDTVVRTGHGDDTTIAAELRNLG